MFCVCAQTGVNRTAREHLAAALALDVPVFAVVTKTDQVDDATLASTLLETRLLLARAADTATAARVVNGGVAGHTTDDTTDVELSIAADMDGGVFATDDDVARSSERRSQVLPPHTLLSFPVEVRAPSKLVMLLVAPISGKYQPLCTFRRPLLLTQLMSEKHSMYRTTSQTVVTSHDVFWSSTAIY